MNVVRILVEVFCGKQSDSSYKYRVGRLTERYGRAWDTKLCESRQRRVRDIVHDVESSNAMVMIMMDEELWKILRLVSDNDAEGYILVFICWRRATLAEIILWAFG
jgi:hypothetical protein